MRYPVLFLGIDGLSPFNYSEIREAGFLRSLSIIERRGVNGSIPMIPPLTPPMWTSMTSGVNPGKHGIYFFVLTDERGRVKRTHGAHDVGFPRIHYVASFNNIRSVVVNLPLSSWPYIPFRGILISDWVSPRQFARPNNVHSVFINHYEELLKRYRAREEGVCKYVVHDLAIAKTLLDLFDKKELPGNAKYFFIMFDFVDELMHKYPEELVQPKHECVKELYSDVDDVIRVLANTFLDEGLVLVAGDHGNDRVRYRVTISRILYDAGLVKASFASLAETEVTGRAKHLEARETMLVKLVNMLMRNKFTGEVVSRIGRIFLRFRPDYVNRIRAIQRPVPDDKESLIIIPKVWHYGLYVNERHALDIDQVIERVKSVIKAYEKKSGHKFVYTIEKGRGGIYHGPYEYRAPHIVVAPRRGYSFASLNLYAPPIEKDPKGLGDHHPENLHIIVPPEGDSVLWDASRRIEKPWDYAALIYMALGIPLPQGIDSDLPQRVGAKVEYRDYLPRYNLLRKAALGLTRVAK